MLPFRPHLATTVLRSYSEQFLLLSTSCPAIKKKLQAMLKGKNRTKQKTTIWRDRASIRTRPGREVGITRPGTSKNCDEYAQGCNGGSRQHTRTNGQCKQRAGNPKKGPSMGWQPYGCAPCLFQISDNKLHLWISWAFLPRSQEPWASMLTHPLPSCVSFQQGATGTTTADQKTWITTSCPVESNLRS